MSESHVVMGLVAKRAELAGRIEQCHRELEWLVAKVSYLDGSIKLFAPDYKLEGIRAKTSRQRNHFFHQGEFQRLALEVFRDAEAPVCTPDRRGLGGTQGTGSDCGSDREDAQECLGCVKAVCWKLC